MKRRNEAGSIKKTQRTQSLIITSVGFFLAFLMIFPIVWLFLSSFKASGELFVYPLHLLPEEFSIESYIKVI
jgi:ABC-type glycerol-3-phosphate transport system permease component